MSSREIAASVLAGLGHCLLGSALAGLVSSGVLIAVVLLLV
jgi:hypothetical protein